MGAVWWKEWRENSYKVGVGLVLSALILVLRQVPAFGDAFAMMVPAWSVLIGVLMAGVLAMDAVAGERRRNTLEFLRTRPLTPLQLLLPKYAAGAGALLLVVAAFWASVYAVPFPTQGDGRWAAWAVADVPWALMVATWYMPLLVAYSLVFVASAATENPAEAGALGAIVALTSVLGLVALAEFWPRTQATALLALMVDLEMHSEGAVVRLAKDPALQAMRAAFTFAAAAAALGAARFLLAHEGEFQLNRRWIVLAGFTLVASALVVPPLVPKGRVYRSPVASASLGAAGLGVVTGVGSSPRTVAAIHAAGVSVFAVPARPDTALVPVGELRLAGLEVRAGSTAAGRLWLAGQADAEGAPVVMAVSLDDPAHPQALTRRAVDIAGRRPSVQTLATLSTGTLAVVARSDRGISVVVLEPGADGTAGERGRLELGGPAGGTGEPDTADVIDAGGSAAPRPLTRPFVGGVAIAADHAYLSLANELVTVDLRPSGALPITQRQTLEPAARAEGLTGVWGLAPRSVVVQGDQLYVQRRWPHECLVLTLRDPDRPEIVSSHKADWFPGRSERFGNLMCSVFTGELEVRAADDLLARPVTVLTADSKRNTFWRPGAPLLIDDRLLLTIGDRLAAFDLPAPLLRAAASCRVPEACPAP